VKLGTGNNTCLVVCTVSIVTTQDLHDNLYISLRGAAGDIHIFCAVASVYDDLHVSLSSRKEEQGPTLVSRTYLIQGYTVNLLQYEPLMGAPIFLDAFMQGIEQLLLVSSRRRSG
jgi:hypothetical protein